jgi:hypothetical protein
MYCFLCGKFSAKPDCFEKFDLPICSNCETNKLAAFYQKDRKVKYAADYTYYPFYLTPKKEICDYCNKEYITHPLFEDFGFTKKVCPDCLKASSINMLIGNLYVKPIYRLRGEIKQD